MKYSEDIKKVGKLCAEALLNGKKVLFCGNGGSAEFSNHIACEFVCKLKDDRRPLNAFSLCSNMALVTAIANDFGFEYVFSRQLEACAQVGDVLFCVSTSGSSKNVLEACKLASALGVYTVGMCGCVDSQLARMADTLILSEGDTAQIQEHQLQLGHTIVKCVEELLGLGLPLGCAINSSDCNAKHCEFTPSPLKI